MGDLKGNLLTFWVSTTVVRVKLSVNVSVNGHWTEGHVCVCVSRQELTDLRLVMTNTRRRGAETTYRENVKWARDKRLKYEYSRHRDGVAVYEYEYE